MSRGDVAPFSLSLSFPRPTEACEIILERGALGRVAAFLEAYAPAPRYAIVSDGTVAALHGSAVQRAIAAAGRPAELLTFPPGEANKNAARWVELLEALGDLPLGRDGCVVAVGGGVTGDMAGFAAAAFARGVAFVQVPTTLLAMVDAALGGKTAIDLGAGKNLAGAFHQPRLVLIDPATLDTLPDAELADGLAEAVKHGAIADAGYFDWMTDHAAAILERDPASLDRLIEDSVRIKTGIVARDPLEAGERALLNFGHTIAHGIEQASGYAIRHGHAVAMGMVVEATLGERLDLTRPGTAHRLRATLAAFGLPISPPHDLDPDAVIHALQSDKKARAGVTHYALIQQIGTPASPPWTHPVPHPLTHAALQTL
jgi:3-dehydroquinate synthase